MHNLHNIYMPEERYPKAAVGPEMVLFCHCKSAEGSALPRLIQAFLVQNWHNPRLVRFEELNAWDCVWREAPALASLLLFYLCRPVKNQYKFGSYISNYIEETGDDAGCRRVCIRWATMRGSDGVIVFGGLRMWLRYVVDCGGGWRKEIRWYSR